MNLGGGRPPQPMAPRPIMTSPGFNPVARPVVPGPMAPMPMSNIGPQIPGNPQPMANTQPIQSNPIVAQRLMGALRNPMMGRM